MTREELCRILEQFTVAVISTANTTLDTDEQYALIVNGIENLVDTVMICAKRDALRYSVN